MSCRQFISALGLQADPILAFGRADLSSSRFLCDFCLGANLVVRDASADTGKLHHQALEHFCVGSYKKLIIGSSVKVKLLKCYTSFNSRLLS